jgi:hypothetical protein
MPLRIQMKRLDIALDREMFDDVITAAASSGFSPLIRNTLSSIKDTLQLKEFPRKKAPLKRRSFVSFASQGLIDGELLLHEEDSTMCYLKLESTTETSPPRTGVYASISSKVCLEAGAITRASKSDVLDKLCACVSAFLKERLPGTSGSPVFHTLVWRNNKLEKLRSEPGITSYQFSENEKSLAVELRDRPLRSLALTLKASGGMLLKDVQTAAKKEGDADLVDRLSKLGLVQREFVIICRKTSQQINRLPDSQVLKDLDKQGLLCSCGRRLSEERVEEILTPSETAKKLLDGGKWLGAALLEELEKLGISEQGVLLNFQQGAEEVDAFFDVEGELGIAELKDKEFSLGHAYPFAGRIGIYKPGYALIVSTEQIAPDVKEHFAKIEPQAKVFYAGNLGDLASTLEEVVTEVRNKRALELVTQFDNLPALSFKIGELLASKLELQQSEPEVKTDGMYSAIDSSFLL